MAKHLKINIPSIKSKDRKILSWRETNHRRETIAKHLKIDTIKSLIVKSEKSENNTFLSWREYFKNIYFINLDKRTDRLEKVIKEFKKYNINAIRWPAIIPKTDNDHDNVGKWGCKLSHIGIIKHAIENNFDRVFIFEDDIILSDDFNEYMDISIKSIQINNIHFDLFYTFSGTDIDNFKFFNKYISKNNRGMVCTHGYGINKEFFNKFIDINLNSKEPIDIVLCRTTLDCIVTNKNICNQYSNWSDIEQRYKRK